MSPDQIYDLCRFVILCAAIVGGMFAISWADRGRSDKK